jgi:capsular exopolysaccharide synthesis family protein
MDINAYIKPLLRWWWLLAAATLVAVISTFLTVRLQPAVYEARTTLMIGRAIDDPNPTQGEFNLAGQLAASYADIANREPVQEATKAALELDRLPEYLARAVPRSQFVEILVTDTNPLRAQVVANELANQLIFRSPTGEGSEDQIRRDFIFDQLNDLQIQILDTRNEIVKLQEELGTINSASELQDTRDQITGLQQKLTTLQTTYATLLSNTQQGATNTLTIVESADFPTNPVSSSKIVIIVMAAGIGFVLAAGAAYLLDYMDDTLKTPEEITELLGLPVIGYIGETENSEGGRNGLYVSHYPRSPVAEAFRSLRSNLNFMGVDKPLKSILITSANVNAGKTSVAANLSAVIAQGDKKVILVDADLRKPSVHEFLDIENDYGLTGIFQNGLNFSEAVTVLDNEKMVVITSGESPPNPSEMLASERMDLILGRLEELVDFVVIDSPPFIVADAIDLGSKVDGVLVVIKPGFTRKKVAKAMMEQFKMSEARMLGVVLNRIPQKGLANYGGYYYDSPYYSNGGYFEGEKKSQEEGQLNQYRAEVKLRIDKLRKRYLKS